MAIVCAFLPFSEPNSDHCIDLHYGELFVVREQRSGWIYGESFMTAKCGYFPENRVVSLGMLDEKPPMQHLYDMAVLSKNLSKLLLLVMKNQRFQDFDAIRGIFVNSINSLDKLKEKNSSETEKSKVFLDCLSQIRSVSVRLNYDLITLLEHDVIGSVFNCSPFSLSILYQHHYYSQGRLIMNSPIINSFSSKREAIIAYDLFHYVVEINEYPSNVFFPFELRASIIYVTQQNKIEILCEESGFVVEKDSPKGFKFIFYDIDSRILKDSNKYFLLFRLVRQLTTDKDREIYPPVKCSTPIRKLVGMAVMGISFTDKNEEMNVPQLKFFSLPEANHWITLETLLDPNAPIVVKDSSTISFKLRRLSSRGEFNSFSALLGFKSLKDCKLCPCVFPIDFAKPTVMHISLVESELSEKKKNVEVTAELIAADSYLVTAFVRFSPLQDKNLMISLNTLSSSFQNETFCVDFGENVSENLQNSDFGHCCVLFHFRVLDSNYDPNSPRPKPFAFAVLKLFDYNNGIIANGVHKIPVFSYKSDPRKDLQKFLNPKAEKTLKKSLTVQTFLSSNVCSQCEHLFHLTKWKQDINNLHNILQNLDFVSHADLYRFFKIILPPLFSIVFEIHAEATKHEAFIVLLRILRIVYSFRASSDAQTQMSLFLSEYFSSVNEQKRTQYFSMIIQLFAQNSNSDVVNVKKTMIESIEVLFFVTVNMELKSSVYISEIKKFFDTVEILLQPQSALVGVQTKALSTFYSLLLLLLKFDIDGDTKNEWHDLILAEIKRYLEILKRNFVESKQFDTKTSRVKSLLGLSRTISSAIFNKIQFRLSIFPIMGDFLFNYLSESFFEYSQMSFMTEDSRNGFFKEWSKAFEAIGLMVDKLFLMADCVERELFTSVFQQFSLFLTESVKIVSPFLANVDTKKEIDIDINSFSEAPLSEDVKEKEAKVSPLLECFYNACFVMVDILLLCDNGTKVLNFLNTNILFSSESDRLDFLSNICILFHDLFNHIPSLWGQPIANCNNAFLKFCTIVEKFNVMELRGVTDKEIHRFLIYYFQAGLSFLSQKSFANPFSFVNLNGHSSYLLFVCGILKQNWEKLGGTVERFLELTFDFIPLLTMQSNELQSFGFSAFNSLITNTFKSTGDLKQIEKHLITAFCKRKNFSLDFIVLFCDSISSIFITQSDDLKVKGEQFVADISHLLNLLNSSQTSLVSHKLFALHDLMMFMKNHCMISLFIKYAVKLKNLHIKEGNFAEAGCAVCAHANLYDWNERMLKKVKQKKDEFPSVPSFKRKIALYEDAITLLQEAKEYEKIVAVYEEIANASLDKLWDVRSAIDNLKKEARYFSMISKDRKIYSFYRVGFFGRKFPPHLRNNQFIYKTSLAERYATFSQNIQTQFKDATVLSRTEYPGKDITEADIFALLITPVQISSEMEMKRYVVKTVPFVSNVFMYAKPKKIENVVSDNEYLSTGLLQEFFITEDTLPSSTMRTKVIRTSTNEYSPLESAVMNVTAKVNELNGLVTHVRQGGPTGPLTMALNGIISAGVNGGIEKYKEAFLTEEYLKTNPKDVSKIDDLKQAINSQFEALDIGMNVHKQFGAEDMRSLEAHLFTELNKGKAIWTKLLKK